MSTAVHMSVTWDIGRRLWNPRVGLFAAALMLLTFQFAYQVKRAQIDPLVMALITLANWGLLIHLLRGPNWRAWWLGCFAAGLGVITKGVGVIALLMLPPYVASRRGAWVGVTLTRPDGWRWARGVFAFFAAILLWLVPMVTVAFWRGTPEYMEYVNDMLLHQTAKRYGGSVGGHAQPFWYFVPVLLFHFFPMSLVYVSTWREWRAGWRQKYARLLLLGALFVLCALVFRVRRGVHALAGGIACFWLVWGFWASPLLNDANSAAGVMRKAGAIAGPTAEIGMVGWKEQNLLMADRPMKYFVFRKPTELQFGEAVAWQAQAPQTRWLFGLREAVRACVQRDKVTVVGYAYRRQWWMFRADAVVPGCVPKFEEAED
jgi:hypothetical protein